MDMSFVGFLNFLLLLLISLLLTISVTAIGIVGLYGVCSGADLILHNSPYPIFFITLYWISIFLLLAFLFYAAITKLVSI